jgi:hypothetical protein
MTVTADTLVAAMAQIDGELVVLEQRRRLMQQLLATFDDADGLTALPDEPCEPLPMATPKTRKPGAGRKPKHDWQAIGEVAQLAAGAGQPVAAALAAEFNVNSTTAYWMVKRCRELGYLGESQRFTAEPITRTEVNEQSARERAAAAL